ncbi:MAG: Arm DNA-binding domain-containing protein [Proteobacteria bacterium]|nr:Arm DNA-binding domain-containing protein [Pseudomonadota bacterium]MBU1688608.1 Arm DNA-binding domain-containing protein [Pseudomonadota bacterium]
MVVEPSGRKWWKLRVVFAKRENSFSLGDYPSVTLSSARGELVKAKSMMAAGIDLSNGVKLLLSPDKARGLP